jgi:nucleoside-diphosphate-sugar epimerase
MKIFVAGSTGVLGKRVVARLLAAGHDVTGMVRPEMDVSQKTARLEQAGARAAVVGLFEPTALRRALDGHDTVVNLATHIPVGSAAVRAGSWKEDDRIRIDGSRILVDAARAAGASRFVQEAVTFVYPDAGETWITEKTPLAPNPKSQTATMTATTNATGFGAPGRTAIVLRFGQLYGPDPNSAETLLRACAGKPAVLGSPNGWLSPLHPDDAADAVVAALMCSAGTYNVAETPVLRADWATAIGRAAGAASAKFYPRLLQRLAGPRAEPLTRSQRVSSDAFASATGWSPRYSCVDGGWADRALTHSA